MFIWSYWKTIWSKPACPSKAVSQECVYQTPQTLGKDSVNCKLLDVLWLQSFFLSVRSAQSREGAVWARGAGWDATRDSEESGEEFTRVYTHGRRRWGLQNSSKTNCGWLTVLLDSRPLEKTLWSDTAVTVASYKKEGHIDLFFIFQFLFVTHMHNIK